MNNNLLAATLGISSLFAAQNAFAVVSWIDWTSMTEGTISIGGTDVGVSVTGDHIAYLDGDTYYNNGSTGGTSATGTYGGLAPSDALQVYYSSTFTLTFDQTITDLYMSMISVGQGNYGVTYDFSDAFTVESYGSNYWGYGGYSVAGDDFTGYEFNGILKFSGNFDSITFNVNPNEYWHAFNFGSEALSVGVPSPAPLALLLAGIPGIVLARKAKQLRK